MSSTLLLHDSGTYYKQILHEFVASATTLYDLISILQSIPLDTIKTLINQHIDSSNTNSSRNRYFNYLSLNQLFPDDITQYILSFGGIYHTKSVCKKWQQLSNKNERIWLTQQYNTIKQIESPLKYDKSINNTWIIHQHRTKLHEIEINSGYKGPMDNIKETIKKCISGDRILIHKGTYYKYRSIMIPKDLQIIGIGDNVIFIDVRFILYDSFCEIRNDIISSNVHLENITIDCSQNEYTTEGEIHIGSNCKLWIKDCQFKFGSNYKLWTNDGITVRNGACLNVKNCEFDGATNAIEISPIAKQVNITQNIFKNCGMETDFYHLAELGCILVYDAYDEVNHDNMDELVRLECVGNIFKHNWCYPIAERHPPNGPHADDKFIIDTNRYILKDNVLRGHNGTNEMEIEDANKLYYNDQPEKDDD